MQAVEEILPVSTAEAGDRPLSEHSCRLSAARKIKFLIAVSVWFLVLAGPLSYCLVLMIAASSSSESRWDESDPAVQHAKSLVMFTGSEILDTVRYFPPIKAVRSAEVLMWRLLLVAAVVDAARHRGAFPL